jgi:hypothetical protein
MLSYIDLVPAQARCVLAWLCEEVINMVNTEAHRDDRWLGLAASCVWLGG